jgi:AcrR family transcriptional regulator
MDPNLKQRIIDEAYVLFLTKGMKQTSFCDVAAAVHKSKGAVMHYFSSKRHLIDTVVKMRFFPASQLSPEMDCLKGRKWDEFLRSYKNPIERVIDSFPEKLEGNGLMYYMQFVCRY